MSADSTTPALPGLQAERTRLAWRRTTLSATGVLLVGATAVLTHRAPLATLGILALAVLAWIGVLVVAYRRIGALARGEVGPDHRAAVLLALLVVTIAVLSGATALIIADAAQR